MVRHGNSDRRSLRRSDHRDHRDRRHRYSGSDPMVRPSIRAVAAAAVESPRLKGSGAAQPNGISMQPLTATMREIGAWSLLQNHRTVCEAAPSCSSALHRRAPNTATEPRQDVPGGLFHCGDGDPAVHHRQRYALAGGASSACTIKPQSGVACCKREGAMQSIIDDFARSFALRMTIVLATGIVIAFFPAPRGLGACLGNSGFYWREEGESDSRLA